MLTFGSEIDVDANSHVKCEQSISFQHHQHATLKNYIADFIIQYRGKMDMISSFVIWFPSLLWMEVSLLSLGWTQQWTFNFNSSDTLITTKWEIQRNNA